MNFFDSLISESLGLIKSLPQQSFTYDENNLWNDVGYNEVILQRDTAVEFEGVGFNLITNEPTDDEIIIVGKDVYQCDETLIAHKDHRIVMSLAVAATLFNKEVIIDGAQAINKSYPTFFEDMKKIGVKVECFDD